MEVSLLYSLGKVAMLFSVGDCYSRFLCGSQCTPNRLCGPLRIASPSDFAASFSLPPVYNKRLHSSKTSASFSYIVAALARLCPLFSSVFQLLGLEVTYRIHLITHIPLENLELLGLRQVEVEWGVGTTPYFSSLLR